MSKTAAFLRSSNPSRQLNVFDVNSSALSDTTGITLSVPSSSAVLINVRGAQAALQNAQVTLNGFPRSSLLWNFPEATEIVLRSISLPGSVLAPSARATVDNGNLEGTLVALSVHGSMQFHDFPLSAWEEFGASAFGRQLRLQPRGRLRAGCEYTLIIDSFPLNDGGDCLEEAFHQSFLVADGMKSNFDREMATRRFDGTPRIPAYFKAKSGINTFVGEAFERYHDTFRLRDGLDSLHLEGTPAPSPLVPGQQLSRFRQFYRGIPVYGHGYLVHEEDGLFRSAIGKLRPSVETSTEPTLSPEAAIDAALAALGLAALPWEADSSIPPPATELMLRLPPGAPDLVLVWRVDLSGIPEADYVDVNASDGTLVTVRSDVASITECTDFDPLLATLDHHEERTITVPFDNVTSLEMDDLALGIWNQSGLLFEAFNNTEPLRFSVAPEDSGPWVLRYADNPEFEDATVVEVTETVVLDGLTYAQVYATLNAGVEYFWQAREGTSGSADAWTQCSPFTASFTTSPKPIHLTIPHRKSKSGYYLTNNMGQVAWQPVRNAGSYQAMLREDGDGCDRPDSDWTDVPLNLWRALNPEVFLGQTVDQNLVLDREPIYLWADTDLAPGTTYHLFVRAVSASGGRGTCSHFEVQKIQLAPFQKVSPLDFATIPYRSGGPLLWTPSEGAARYELTVQNFQLNDGWQEVWREVLDADGLEVNDDNQISLTLGDDSVTSIPGQMTWHVTAVHESGDRRGGWDPGVPDYRTDANFWNGPEKILETVTEDGTNAPAAEDTPTTVVNLAFPEGDERETQTCFDPGDNTAGVLWALYPAGTTEVNLEDFQDLPLDPDADDDFPVCTPRYELVDDVTFLVAYPYSNLIHEVPTALGDPTVLLLQVRTCGGEGHECCDDGTCVDGLVCDEGICADVECGAFGQPCCPGQQCPSLAGIRWVCLDNECLSCGSTGKPCCTDGDPCSNVTACDGGRCRYGVDGAPPCDSGNPSSGGCATPNTTNQGGSCEPVLPCGTPVSYEGANTPESYEIEMGASQGSAILWVNTYNVPDNFHVYYEGDFLFDSDCVGTNYTIAGCYHDSLFNVQTCCDGAGWCSMSFAYGPGSSRNLTVEVEPNCAGTPDTKWEFRVECPD